MNWKRWECSWVMKLMIWLVVLAVSTTSTVFFAAKAAGGAPVVAKATVVMAPATFPRCFITIWCVHFILAWVPDASTLAEMIWGIIYESMDSYLYNTLAFGLLLSSHLQCYIGSGWRFSVMENWLWDVQFNLRVWSRSISSYLMALGELIGANAEAVATTRENKASELFTIFLQF